MPRARCPRSTRPARVRHAAAGGGSAVSDESPERAIRHRPIRAAYRRDARSRASLLPGAGADRRRQDGQVRDRERREGVEHGLLPHVGLPLAPRRRSTRWPIISSTARSAARSSITNSSSPLRRRYFRARRQRPSPRSTPRATGDRWLRHARRLRGEHVVHREHAASRRPLPRTARAESDQSDDRRPAERRRTNRGRGTRAAGTTRSPGIPTRYSSFIISRSSTTRSTPTARRRRPIT